MTQAIWTQSYPVNTILVNAQKRLGLVGLLSILQDVAWAHAEHLGHGYEATMERGAIWVLSRQKLVMADWPIWRDELLVRTWIRPIRGPLIHRDYEMLIGDRKVGEWTASWLTLDVKTRRPVRPAAAGTQLACRPDGALASTPEKIAVRQDLTEATRFSGAQQRPGFEWARQQYPLRPMDSSTRRRPKPIGRIASTATR